VLEKRKNLNVLGAHGICVFPTIKKQKFFLKQKMIVLINIKLGKL
jgi:hypothetical protein